MKKIIILTIISMILVSGCGKEKEKKQEAKDLTTENYDIVNDETLVDSDIFSENESENSV